MLNEKTMLHTVAELLPEQILSVYTPKEVISVDSRETLLRAVSKKTGETVTIRITEKTADPSLPSDHGREKQKGRGSAPAAFANEDFYFTVISADAPERQEKAVGDDPAGEKQAGGTFVSAGKRLFGNQPKSAGTFFADARNGGQHQVFDAERVVDDDCRQQESKTWDVGEDISAAESREGKEEKNNRRPLYAFLFVCAAVMVFSAYHFAANRKNGAAELSADWLAAEEISAKDGAAAAGGSAADNSVDVAEGGGSAAENTVSAADNSVNAADGGSAVIVSDTDRILDISGSGFSDSSFLADVATPGDVRILIADGCQFADARAFAGLGNVEELYLNGNPITSTQGFDRLENLSVLVLSDCSGDLETADSADSAGSVSPAGLTDVSDLSTLESLTVLDLSHNTSLENIRSLCLLQNLELLILTNTNVSESDVEYLKESLPHCTVIY